MVTWVNIINILGKNMNCYRYVKTNTILTKATTKTNKCTNKNINKIFETKKNQYFERTLIFA